MSRARSIFADRWEHLVYGVLFKAAQNPAEHRRRAEAGRARSTVSFMVADFNRNPARQAGPRRVRLGVGE